MDPAPAGDRMFGVASPYAAGHLTPHVMLLADYAHDPLVVREEGTGEVVGAVVGSQLILHLDAALALWSRVLVDVDLPLALVQSGDDPGAGRFASPSGPELGDLRFGARARLLGEEQAPFQAALGASLWLPTTGEGSFVGDSGVRFMPQGIVGGRLAPLVWSFAVGPELRSTQEFAGVTQGTMLRWGGGVGFLMMDERLQVGPEVRFAMVLADVDARTVNAEALLDGRYRVLRDVEVGLGVGPGLTGGVGTPDLRVVAMAAYTPLQERVRDRDGPPADRDHDGVTDVKDACPDVPGVQSDDPKKNGCAPDRDSDGVTDAKDACPDVPGVQSDDPKKNGCAPDRDGDGIPDASDACPDHAGEPNPDPAKHGCPTLDTDHDGIPDAFDSCPQEKGFPSAELDKNGCPKTVRVTLEEVVLLQQVQFDTDRATLKPVSDPILDEVAQVLKEHPEILSVEVQGHTDERGTKEHNKVLSQQRAEAVVRALVSRGIEADRMTAKGYGRDVPLDKNDTEEGRQKNRRVQFKIVQTTTRRP